MVDDETACSLCEGMGYHILQCTPYTVGGRYAGEGEWHKHVACGCTDADGPSTWAELEAEREEAEQWGGR